ncbi:MAG: hypothetical protein NT075_07240 [Chloroflexi bacterium]|nr:hypothetical protein [Chloroflexota bacterium]
MKRIPWTSVGSMLLLGFVLTACGSTNAPTPDIVATAVAATLTAIAPTQAATVAPAPATNRPATQSPTDTPIPAPPTATAVPPTPTPIVIDDLPVDGENGNLSLRGDRTTKEGRYVLLPQIPRDQVTTPMVFRGQIALRVEVFDPQRGEKDGAGIQAVTFSIIDNETNDVVYQNQETSAPFCLFGSNEPLCSLLIFAQTNFRWPNGQPIYNGRYTAQIVIQPQSGDNATWNFNFSIAEAKQRPAATSELVGEIVQTGAGNTDNALTDSLVFQVEAYNPDVGANDGDGIDHVDMDIFGPNGKRVYHRVESTVHYCAFGGGEPDCTLFSFDDNYYRWPNNGPAISNGQYRLVATIHATDGRSKTVETNVEIRGVP